MVVVMVDGTIDLFFSCTISFHIFYNLLVLRIKPEKHFLFKK